MATSQRTDVRPEHQLYHEYSTDVDQARTNVHYEQPPEFFLLITGGEWNVYSANLWDPGTEDDTASQAGQARPDRPARGPREGHAPHRRGLRLGGPAHVSLRHVRPHRDRADALADPEGLRRGADRSPRRRREDRAQPLGGLHARGAGRRDLHRRGDRPLLQPRRVLHQVPRLAQARRRDDQQGAAPQASAPRQARPRRRVRQPDLRRHRQLPDALRGDAASPTTPASTSSACTTSSGATTRSPSTTGWRTCTSTPDQLKEMVGDQHYRDFRVYLGSPGTSSAT